MIHLGDRVASLVDGQLPVDAAERAYAHIATCPACRTQVEEERLTKSRLAALGDPRPADSLVTRLMELATPDGLLAPRDGYVPGSPRPQTVPITPRAAVASRPPGAADGSSRPPGRRSGRGRGLGSVRPRARFAAAVVGALSLISAGVAAGVVTAGSTVGPAVVPPIDTFVVEHQATTVDLPFLDESSGWGELPVTGGGR